MEVTDKQVAEFVGVEDRTLRNWKKPQITDGAKFYPPTGRHNLYKGARIATYLLDYPTYTDEDGEKVSEWSNRLDDLVSSSQELSELVELACKESPYYTRLKELSSIIKSTIEDIEKLSHLQ